MKKQLLFLSFFLCCSQIDALLPPLYESKREIEAILSHPALSPFTGEMILSLEKTEDGYLLETTHYFFFIEIKKLPSNKIGPAQFEVLFQKIEKKTS